MSNTNLSVRISEAQANTVDLLMKATGANFASEVIRALLDTISGGYEFNLSTCDKKLVNMIFVQIITMQCIKDELKRIIANNPKRKEELINLSTAFELAYISLEQIITKAQDSPNYPLSQNDENDMVYFAMVFDQLISNLSKKVSDFKNVANELKRKYNIELAY